MNGAPILSIRELDASHGDLKVLFGVSLELQAGAMLALIGANGAGKSTLLRTIVGLVAAPHDAIRFREQAIGGLAPDRIAKLGIAMVPEGRRLFRSLTVEENLVIGAQVGRKGRWSLESIYRLFPALRERRHAASSVLSGGQQQMVAIGRALMANPELILFDEISLGLAPVVIKGIYAALPSIVETGVSIVLVEQDVNRALGVARDFVCLQEGRVTLSGPAHSTSRRAITAAYFGV
ncbi:MAG: ABC transporter ATP-binding protein [Roseiarcus sp.]|jgi:branched-chain amino acid transport system ATP-binding protein